MDVRGLRACHILHTFPQASARSTCRCGQEIPTHTFPMGLTRRYASAFVWPL